MKKQFATMLAATAVLGVTTAFAEDVHYISSITMKDVLGVSMFPQLNYLS